eukprot:6684924-Pyramimonas_sp.AAC.1
MEVLPIDNRITEVLEAVEKGAAMWHCCFRPSLALRRHRPCRRRREQRPKQRHRDLPPLASPSGTQSSRVYFITRRSMTKKNTLFASSEGSCEMPTLLRGMRKCQRAV